jgi:LPXTG-motif cell wall-anchored protein
MKIRITILLVSLTVHLICFTQTITVSSSTDKKKILIGEQFRLTIKVLFPPGSQITFPGIDSISHFEIIDTGKQSKTQSGNLTTISQILLLTSFDSGRWVIPSFKFGNKYFTQKIPVEVVFSNFNPKQEYHDIKEIIKVEKPPRVTWYWYLIGGALLLLVGVLFLPKRKKREVKSLHIHAYENAQAELKKIEYGEFAGDAKVYYTSLIHIFKTYLLQKKNIQSFSKTSDDLGLQIKQLNLPTDVYSHLLQTLRLSDLVKFAKFIPEPAERKKSFEIIKTSITTIENN